MPSEDVRALFRLYAVLAVAKGEAVTAEDVHNAWSAWMQQADPHHDSLRPFDELDSTTQAAEDPFVDAIHAASRELALAPRD